jgi:hypothetical protein
VNDTAFEHATTACWTLSAACPSRGQRTSVAATMRLRASALPRPRIADPTVVAADPTVAGHHGRWPTWRGRPSGAAVMAAMTKAADNGHGRDTPGVTGQPLPVLPWPVAMTGVVQPRGRDGVELRCLACGLVFVAKRRDARSCSRRCAARLWPSRSEARTSTGVRRCEEPSCDTVLTGRSDRRFCSHRCRKRAQRRRRADRSAAPEAGRQAPATEREPGQAD